MSDQLAFDPASVDTFRITDWDYDPVARLVTLRYAFDDREHFAETIEFVTEPTVRGGGFDVDGFSRAIDHLHIAAGVSYFKAAAPATVSIERAALTPAQLRFHSLLYDEGLREFAVTNGRAVPVDVTLRTQPVGATPPDPMPSAARSDSRPPSLLVPIGGGKDSMVLIEAVRSLGPRLFSVNPHPLVTELASLAGLELIEVRRRLSPNLGELNGRGALNGHVPITAIVSLIAVAGSFLYGYDIIAMAIERSASEETSMVDGVAVNHQFSKSYPFELALQELVTSSIDAGLTYGSALRPYSELAISRSFAQLTRYHGTFCSCNTAFRSAAAAGDRWCGHCPKCRFVGLMLAPFLDRAALTAIIGRDMFADPGQIDGFRSLMSTDDKPFECVGERRESAVAIRLLGRRPEWAESPVIAALAPDAERLTSDQDVEELFARDRTVGMGLGDIEELVARLIEAPTVPSSS
ncbi:MAG TPA: hypothetical protein VHU17_02730 [Acidimicrobiales bacterium]|jgi:hypothetical protein|nr:hypothetical protein [Acidimicrobiales bacterium]